VRGERDVGDGDGGKERKTGGMIGVGLSGELSGWCMMLWERRGIRRREDIWAYRNCCNERYDGV
jgi:hypothetical protein